MTGKDLLENLSFIEERFVEEAEKKAAVGTQEPRKGAVRRFPVKKVLIAAVIALMLTLVGCAVAYIMHMKDFQVGEQEATKPVFENYGLEFQGYVPIKEQVLTLSGLEGSPGFQAAKEWYEFKQNYDPDHRIIVELMQEEKVPEFPAEYNAYNIYTQEMKDKLDEILRTYDLKPVGELLNFRTERNLYEALGIDSFLKTEGEVTVTGDGGGCYENGNFWLNLDFQVPVDEESQVERTTGVLRWNRKDCFSEDLITIEESGDWKEWNYTLSSGRKALILRSPSDWHGWILCDRGSAILSLWVGARQDIFTNDGEKDLLVYEYMSDRQLEAIAEAIDQGIEPRFVTREDVENQPKPSNLATQDGYTVEMKGIETDGYLIRITLGITAPEGTIISRNTRPGEEELPFTIRCHNLQDLISDEGEMESFGSRWMPQEDGDGRDNTQNIVIEASGVTEDGEPPFASGKGWTLRIENLINSYLTKNYDYVEETLAEGEWIFPFTIGENDGDFREAELLSEPLSLRGRVGQDLQGNELYEDVEITSFRLHAFMAILTTEGFIGFDADQRFYAVMRDTARIELADHAGDWHTHELKAEIPIDLDQVDYVLLPEGTRLPMPEQP